MLSFPVFSVLTERRTLIPMATQITVPNLTLSQDARLYKYVRLPSGWKYLRADYSEGFGWKPHSVFLPKTKTPGVCLRLNLIGDCCSDWLDERWQSWRDQWDSNTVHDTAECFQ